MSLHQKYRPDAMETAPSERAPWMRIALGEQGQREIAGAAANPRILEYHATTTLRATSDEVAWCSAFVNWVLVLAGYRATKSAMARSWLGGGERVSQPEYGDIVVFRRPGGGPQAGHVGFYVGSGFGFVEVLGGNQGDQVCVSKYSATDVIGFIRPEKEN